MLPFLFLGLLELVLRWCHYGYDPRLFIPYPQDSRYLVFNPDAGKRYFSDQVLATTGNVEPFLRKKEDGTLRIFVLGESTTIGYPYFHNGSAHRWIQYRLMRTFPGKKFEIINLSLTATNSYTVYGFAKELVDYEPDAVLIYCGQNEYYGALGVGSTNKIGGNPFLVQTALSLRNLRLFQLATRAYQACFHRTSDKDKAGKTRMELMVGEQHIPYGSPLYLRGIAQFQRNMNATLGLFQDNHIPVFLSNLVVNEKDQPPLSESAQAHKYYNMGLNAYAAGDFGAAKALFDSASNWDELRFRAPDTLNTIIRELCTAYPSSRLVDTKAAFEGASPHGILGRELILEHIHPNLEGYAYMGDAFYRALKQAGIFHPDSSQELGFDALVRDMPLTKVDSLTGAYKVLNLKSSWPFGQGLPKDSLKLNSEEEELAFSMAFRHMPWDQAMSDLYDYYMKEHELAEAGRVMEALALDHVTEAAYADKAANIYGQLQDNERAIFYFQQDFTLSPSFDKARDLFVLELKADRPEAAQPYLDYAMQNNTTGMNLEPVKFYTNQVIKYKKSLGASTTDTTLYRQIAQAYRKMGNEDGAHKYEQMASGQER
jgi:tetratricopeptide (TPR) repeat protein